ncbi:unnamed protein product [Owenia fusiformis]|uniref:Uncharacterized protein n=1 Tax=Owenia fusiformis TaxID=6347 RepID=A0A8S4N6F6_OWEFU|nr:unnamed protein product [Owenia fusiformis]
MRWQVIWLATLGLLNVFKVGFTLPTARIGVILGFNITANNYIMKNAIDRINNLHRKAFNIELVHLPWSLSPELFYEDVCKRIEAYPLMALLVVGESSHVKRATVISRQLGLPLMAFDTTSTGKTIKDNAHLYLQLEPSRAVLARAVLATLNESDWMTISLVLEESYATDGFERSIKQTMGLDTRWTLANDVRINMNEDDDSIVGKLNILHDSEARIHILHCSEKLARRIFELAATVGGGADSLMGEGNAWVTTDVAIHQWKPHAYPVGLVAIVFDKNTNNILDDLLHVFLLASNKLAFITPNYAHIIEDISATQSCWRTPGPKARSISNTLYSSLLQINYKGKGGPLSFNEQGYREQANFSIINLVSIYGSQKWRKIGSVHNDIVNVTTIVWPGNTVSGPLSRGKKKYRVVTNIVEPFVRAFTPYKEDKSCVSTVPCLDVNGTRDVTTLDAIFDDYANGTISPSRPYEIKCCEGLSIDILERLSRDLEFDYDLYIVGDGMYGAIVNGSWNGLVADLKSGAAQMAMAAFSITGSRSAVIDYTEPYFHSGFSILAAEKKKEVDYNAFSQPFDESVWICIAVSATVTAIAMALFEWNSPFGLNPWGRKRAKNYTLASALNMVYAILFGHTVKTKSPKSWPCKWFQNFWAASSIFIFASYTANLAAFIAGKNEALLISGIHDPKLFDDRVGSLASSSVQSYIKLLNPPLYEHTVKNQQPSTMEGVQALKTGKIDAYLDDTPVLEYARATMDNDCKLKMVGQGFGDDGYGIGLQKNSWIQEVLSKKILDYHESGYIEDLRRHYFNVRACAREGAKQEGLQPTHFAGLFYVLLGALIFSFIMLLSMEYALFKWFVPWCRRRNSKSFFKSLHMMFISQRLFRIITSEKLVSPNHSAKEMGQILKSRQFIQLFQKSVKKKDKNPVVKRKNDFFNLVDQLRWQQTVELTQAQGKRRRPTMQEIQQEFQFKKLSVKSLDNISGSEAGSAISESNINAIDSYFENALRGEQSEASINNILDDLGHEDDWPTDWEAEWIAEDGESIISNENETSYSPNTHANLAYSESAGSDIISRRSSVQSSSVKSRKGSKKQQTIREVAQPPKILEYRKINSASSGSPPDSVHNNLGRSSSEAEETMSNGEVPNGVLILSPTGEIFACNAMNKNTRTTDFLPKKDRGGNWRNLTSSLPESMKTLPLKDNRVKQNFRQSISSNQKNVEAGMSDSDTEDIESIKLDNVSKEEIVYMWKQAMVQLNSRLRQALKDKAKLEIKLSQLNTVENSYL